MVDLGTVGVTGGDILTAGSIVVGGAIFVINVRSKLDLLTQALNNIDKRLTDVENMIKGFSDQTIEIAKNKVHIEALEERLDDMDKEIRYRRRR